MVAMDIGRKYISARDAGIGVGSGVAGEFYCGCIRENLKFK
jgi:hypothetical protein